MRSPKVLASLALLLATAAPRTASADEPEAPPSEAPPDRPVPPAPVPPANPPPLAKAPEPPVTPPTPEPGKPTLKLTPLGYVEAHYAYNFNRPSNAITHFRGFDNRHNTFTLANAALGVNAEYGPVTARVIAQVGSTPSTYYLAEPALAGTGGTNATSAELWKYLQEANLSYNAPIGRGLLLQMGLVPSPIGVETFAVKDNYNYSRSNLFFGFPFYHTGIRATYAWTDALSTTVAVFNGWNSVVDNNEEKSVQANIAYSVPGRFAVQALYFGGVERPATARRPEGPAWRHDFDVWAQVTPTTFLSFMAEANHGWEVNRIGTANWTAGALYARVKPVDRVFVALRVDRFHENLATDRAGRSSTPIFWGGVEWVSSGTATLEVRPHDNVSVRLEGRHDIAASPLFYGRNVRADIPNARTQSTLLLGATAWF